MDAQDLERLTYSHIPPKFLRDACRGVFVSRQHAWEHCRREFADPEAENLLGFYRRAEIEGMLRGVAERHGLHSQVKKEEKQPWNHTEIVGGPIVLTAHSVRTPLAVVEDAEYRRTLAEGNQERLDLFREDPDPESPLYVLLIHSKSYWLNPEEERNYGYLPGSIYLAYPARDLEYYVHWINLFDQFPEVVLDQTPQEWDEATLRRYVERARRTA